MANAPQTRQIGCACRIYKNAGGEVLAIDHIAVVEEVRVIRATKRLRTASKTVQRTLFHLGGARTIASIEMIGTYDSIEASFLHMTWSGTADSNDITISLADLPQISESV